jgi:hypothetical protein
MNDDTNDTNRLDAIIKEVESVLGGGWWHRAQCDIHKNPFIGRPLTPRQIIDAAMAAPKPKFVAPPFNAETRLKITPTSKFYWWSWNPHYPFWSRSCWGGLTEEEAWKDLENPLACKMRLYHNKLIREGDLAEMADLPPCENVEQWNDLIRELQV